MPNVPLMTRFSGQDSQAPPPSVQAVGEMRSDQQRNEPSAPAVSSAMRRRQVPLAATPDFSLNAPSGCSGRNVPTKGAVPAVIAVIAESLNVVRLGSVQSVP